MKRDITSKTIDDLTYMDDIFLSAALHDNLPAVQLMIRIILDDDRIVVTREVSQKELKNLYGRSIRCDAYSEDDRNRKYDIEIQNGREGASVVRARYNSAMLDTDNSLTGEEIAGNLKESYVIFITDHDHFYRGWPSYRIERFLTAQADDSTAVENVRDGSHIIYVNGSYDDVTSPIGQLIADLRCTDPQDIHYEELRDRAYYLKHSEEGRKYMSTTLNNLLQYTDAQRLVQDVENASRNFGITVEEACRGLEISLDDYKTAKKLLEEEALAV